MNRPNAKTDKFVALLCPLQRPLEVYCRRMLRNPSLVEDVIQDAVSGAFARFDRYTEGTNFKAWIFRFVTLEIFNRNRKHEPIALEDLYSSELAEKSCDFAPSEDIYAAMLSDPDVLLDHLDDSLVGALEKLPTPERAVLLLRAIGEFSCYEIHGLL